MTSTMDDLSLGQLFTQGQHLLIALESSSLPSIDSQYQADVQQGLAYLTHADTLLDRLGLFSSNEFLDDMNTNDLRFLLLPAYLGELVLKQTQGERKSILEQAKAYFIRYLTVCQEHQLVQKQDLQLIEAGAQDTRRPMSAAQQRQDKISRYRREKTLREKLAGLREQLEQQQARQDNGQDNGEEDIEREIVMAMMDMYIIKCIEHTEAIQQEMVMVNTMAEKKDERMDRTGETVHDDRVSVRANAAWGRDKPLLSQQGKPLQPFVLTNRRQQIVDQVFQQGHRLPTMTIDEYLEQEMAQGNIISGGGKEPEKKTVDQDNEAAVDAETLKQRQWDEFKEANPRGWGNRGNKGY
ncbi:TAP42-like protein [Spinellus fusiger]|nr:TAP42-like protein [Spinellus fusiger]